MGSRGKWLVGSAVVLIFSQWIVSIYVALSPKNSIQCRRLEIVNSEGKVFCVLAVTGQPRSERVELIMKTPTLEDGVTINSGAIESSISLSNPPNATESMRVTANKAGCSMLLGGPGAGTTYVSAGHLHLGDKSSSMDASSGGLSVSDGKDLASISTGSLIVNEHVYR